MIFFTTPAIVGNKKNKVIINSFGADNIPSHLKLTQRLEDLEIPVRDDGAKFEGWYYSLNFDKQFRSDICVFEAIVINAKYDKCYCFSLRHNILGCFGKYDESIKEENSDDYRINYYVPKGAYRVTFTEFSKANKGILKVFNNNNELIKEYDYENIGNYKHLTINENEYINLSNNSVFMFQRTDVDSKYTKFKID